MRLSLNKIKSKYITMDILAYSEGYSEALQLLFFASRATRYNLIKNYKLIKRIVKRAPEVERLKILWNSDKWNGPHLLL